MIGLLPQTPPEGPLPPTFTSPPRGPTRVPATRCVRVFQCRLATPCSVSPTIPGRLMQEWFRLHPTVDRWREWRDWGLGSGDDLSTVASRFQERLRASGALDSPQGAAYWAYHMARVTFFTASGALGAILSGQNAANFTGSSPDDSIKRLSLMVNESLAMFKQDWESIQAGDFRLPWDLDTAPMHRQFNPLFVADRAVRFLAEARGTLGRSATKTPDRVWLTSPFVSTRRIRPCRAHWKRCSPRPPSPRSCPTTMMGRRSTSRRTAG